MNLMFNISALELLDNYIDLIENKKELNEQLEADLYYSGINKDIKRKVIDDLINTLNSLIPNIIIATYEED